MTKTPKTAEMSDAQIAKSSYLRANVSDANFRTKVTEILAPISRVINSRSRGRQWQIFPISSKHAIV